MFRYNELELTRFSKSFPGVSRVLFLNVTNILGIFQVFQAFFQVFMGLPLGFFLGHIFQYVSTIVHQTYMTENLYICQGTWKTWKTKMPHSPYATQAAVVGA